ncbi:MAG: sirohydrochlorin cobaltochelatase, partial [Desulfobulbaceae bacterium]|nr:sirohydrochlorin cobaltochelatase [Desulfobulbaceae bacterium]
IVHEYHLDLERAARAVAADVELAEQNGAALVYMGHGNDHFSTGVYVEFTELMRKMYPRTKTYVTMVEGFPSHELLFRELTRDKISKIYLKTMMTVAGDHAKNDMAGADDDSLNTQLLARGFEVEVNLHGLGENKEFAAIFVANIREAARDNGLKL